MCIFKVFVNLYASVCPSLYKFLKLNEFELISLKLYFHLSQDFVNIEIIKQVFRQNNRDLMFVCLLLLVSRGSSSFYSQTEQANTDFNNSLIP